MRTVKQSFFDEFICIADKCPDTCCQGWEIAMDQETLDKYKKYDGPLKDKLDEAMDYEREVIRFGCDGKCPMLREDGLCSLVLDIGEENLGYTCHTYPRHVEEYEGLREWSVALSCPHAAHLILNDMSSSYIEEEDDEEDPLEDDFDDFDLLLFTKLEDSRDVIYKIMKNRKYPALQRMGWCLKLARELQDLLDNDRIFEMDDCINEWNEGYEDKEYISLYDYQYIDENIDALVRMERLRSDWNDVVDKGGYFISKGEEHFEMQKTAFDEAMNKFDHDRILENIFGSFVYTYYLGAVYDDMIYAKVAMSVFAVCMMDYLLMCEYENRYEELNVYAYETIAHRFAKELEHSDENLNAVEDYFG